MNASRPSKARPWIMRTYSGYNTAKASNELYRKNIGKGQTGLSVAFDLPTQTGYDSDHPLARGEVGKETPSRMMVAACAALTGALSRKSSARWAIAARI